MYDIIDGFNKNIFLVKPKSQFKTNQYDELPIWDAVKRKNFDEIKNIVNKARNEKL